ncbi:Triosephosphate isomerase [Xylogone sp. PMI_703]|nr:Triosephosphate isomerase [Xylogone sp. PMI_703]
MTNEDGEQRGGNGLRRIVGVSLKMYFSIDETIAYVTELQRLGLVAAACGVELFVIPDFLSLPAISNILRGVSPVRFGAQDCFWEDKGAFTGEVSPALLKSLGCSLVELGHAERRRIFRETDSDVQRKARAVERNGMTPLICIGEKNCRSAEEAVEECRPQIETALQATEKEVIFAYEPVWAIGQAEAASAEYVVQVTKGLRKLCGDRDVRIIYGGSAGPGTFQPMSGGVDGLFLGRFAHNIVNVHNIIKEVASSITPA